jgi:dienelactone hydrolase
MIAPPFRLLAALLSCTVAASAAETATADLRPSDRMLKRYFEEETARLASETFANTKTLEDWTSRRETYREQLYEMAGLSPRPEKTDLKAVVTGRVEHADFTVENLHYQSMPGLYATGNLYLPKNRNGKVPAILYVCGHANVKEGGISYGAKANYQHHGEWFARHGYVCLTIDTIQLGELEGLHHGTYREGMWWWNARGYTPGGVEAWNSIRALDYLQSRPEVDGEKLGMTGRSGGGAYTWLTAALDERVKVAVPVAGMTDLQNYVVDGCVTGHCDCMFIVNTYRWDYPKMAALIAPRPLLISNSDKDRIFPLDGVQRVHRAVASIYQLYNASDKLGLLITEGPHRDTQDLQVPAFRWFNRFLKGEEPLIRTAAEKLLAPKQLKAFATLPTAQRTTKIHETFVPMAAPAIPRHAADWQKQRASWEQALREKAFAGWPATEEPVRLVELSQRTHDGVRLTTYEYTSQGAIRLPLVVMSKGDLRSVKDVHVHVPDEQTWTAVTNVFGSLVSSGNTAASSQSPAGKLPAHLQTLHARVQRGEIAIAYVPPRGIGPMAFSGNAKDQVQIRRRFMLLGQTLDSMRVWDIRRAIVALKQPELFSQASLRLQGDRVQAVNTLYASLFIDGLKSVELIAPPASHVAGPDYLNVLRFLDIPQAAAMAAERQPVKWTEASAEAWAWTTQTAQALKWPADRLQW